MASPEMEASETPPSEPATFVTSERPPPSPDPGPLEPESEPSESGGAKQWATGLLILVALALGTATVLLVENPLAPWEQVVLIGLSSGIAALGLLPAVRGWYVMALVTAAYYGLNIYNLATDAPMFELFQAQEYGFAVLSPAVGVVVGAASQLLYRIIGGE